jgi:hypothetical protein
MKPWVILGIAIAASASVCALIVGAPVHRERVSQVSRVQEFEKRLLANCWRNIERLESGESGTKYGWRIKKDEVECWGYSGELSTAKMDWVVQIDVSRTPIWMDIVTVEPDKNGKRHARPGIAKFEKDRLVWIYAGGGGKREYDPGGKYSNRPTEFVSTKENEYVKQVFAKCEYMEQAGADPEELPESTQ